MDFNNLRRCSVELRLDLIDKHPQRMKIYLLISRAGSVSVNVKMPLSFQFKVNEKIAKTQSMFFTAQSSYARFFKILKRNTRTSVNRYQRTAQVQ